MIIFDRSEIEYKGYCLELNHFDVAIVELYSANGDLIKAFALDDIGFALDNKKENELYFEYGATIKKN